MQLMAIIKRFLPFFLTLVVGLFIASFFVSVAAPRFEFRRGWRGHRDCQRLKWENRRLQEQNENLKRRNTQLESEGVGIGSAGFNGDINVPPPPLPPAPPAPPKPLSVPRSTR